MNQTQRTEDRHRARHLRGAADRDGGLVTTRDRNTDSDRRVRRPGVGTFIGVALLGGLFVAAVQQAPHDARWDPVLVVIGAAVVGLLGWAVRYGIYRLRRDRAD